MSQLLPKRYLYSLSWQNVERGGNLIPQCQLIQRTLASPWSYPAVTCLHLTAEWGTAAPCLGALEVHPGARSATQITRWDFRISKQWLWRLLPSVMRCLVLRLIYTNVLAKKEKGKFACAKPCRPEGGIEVFLHSFLTSAQDRGRWQASNLVERALVPLGKRLGGLQSQSAHFREENNFLSLPGFVPWIIQPVA